MVFSSPVFVFLFLPVVYAADKLLPMRARNYLLILASLVFYAWGEPVFIVLMMASVTANYVLALLIERNRQQPKAMRVWLAVCAIVNLGMLFVFKYANFFVANINALLAVSIPGPDIRLPIGISFYTFQAMSYVIDVYRGVSKAQKNYANVLLYISFFPQLIAGPIVKYHDIALQIENRAETVEKTVAGLKRFTVGLAKKILIANAMGAVADKAFALPLGDVSIGVAWLGALTYSLQIYFDFSGYSDMAIGLAKLFGFELKENFLYPYTAGSIKQFWRKWHVSLSTWFKEYLYIPLGGNRRGTARTVLNLVFVFFCTGLWHGAEWTFVVWGLFHGLFLMLERVGAIRPERFKPKWLGSVYTLLVVLTAFTIFRAETLLQGFSYIARMFSGFAATDMSIRFLSEALTPSVIVFGALGIVGSTPLPKMIYERIRSRASRLAEYGSMAAALALLIVCALVLSSQTYNPFIYFRF
jgi:alginate O-acetyltransferase complex protein AlgI